MLTVIYSPTFVCMIVQNQMQESIVKLIVACIPVNFFNRMLVGMITYSIFLIKQ